VYRLRCAELVSSSTGLISRIVVVHLVDRVRIKQIWQLYNIYYKIDNFSPRAIIALFFGFIYYVRTINFRQSLENVMLSLLIQVKEVRIISVMLNFWN
jgi:hypothetical protein